MLVEIITKEDLESFKSDMLAEIRSICAPAKIEKRQWLKSFEVRQLLGISNGTLQAMRINGTIQYSRVGGLLFYSYDDIAKLMEKDKKNVKKR